MSQDINIERCVVGSILVDPKHIKKIREQISYKDFADPIYQTVFRGMEWLDKQDIEIDLATLSDALKKAGVLDRIGGISYLSSLTDDIPSISRVMTYVKIVAENSAKRGISSAARELADMGTNITLDEAISKLKEKVTEVNNLGGKQNRYQVASMIDYIDDAKKRFENWGSMQGLSTGFPSIDEQTLGLVGGELIIVAGQTSRGKTLLSMNIANNIAKAGHTVLFVTLEMTHAELTSRYMFVNGGAETMDFAQVATNTIFQANDELDWKDIDGLIRNAREELNVDLVIIDHLHYFTRELQNVSEDLGRITKEFKKNAIRYNIPIILISHVRKMAKDEKLSGESLRGSSLIAQDADIVLLVDRDPETNAMGVMIDKNRNRGKTSDRTKNWEGQDEREINTIFLDFNNTKLKDPKQLPGPVQQMFPGAVPYEEV